MTRSTSVRRSRRTAVVAAAAAAAVLLAAGCASTASAGGSKEPAQAATYAGTTTTFGESYTYANGLVVEVKKPVRFTPSEGADGIDGTEGEPVRVRVNLINGTSNEFVPDKVGVSIESAGVQATQIHDPGSRIELTGPSRSLGRSDVVAFDLAFVVADLDDLTLTLTPALAGYDPVVYTVG